MTSNNDLIKFSPPGSARTTPVLQPVQPTAEAIYLRNIQMRNPRFLARHQEHQAKLHAESEKNQKDKKFNKDKLQQLEYAKVYFDQLIVAIQQQVNQNFINGMTFSNFAQANQEISDLNFYVTRLVETYDNYLGYMLDIQRYFDQQARDKVENEHGYDKYYKDSILKLTNELYEKIGIVQGFAYPSIIRDIRNLFETLEKHGGPAVELFIDVDTAPMRHTYNETFQGYLQMGYPAAVIEAQIREVLGYDMADIQELEVMKIK